MREIKFRAWDKKNKKMKEVEEINWKKGLLWRDGDGIGKVWIPNIDGSKDVELIEYTGLKDKNDKEIYEGDIIRDDNEGGGITKVELNNGCWEIWVSYDEPSGTLSGIRFGYWISDAMNKVEIIGNIYENKELLK